MWKGDAAVAVVASIFSSVGVWVRELGFCGQERRESTEHHRRIDASLACVYGAELKVRVVDAELTVESLTPESDKADTGDDRIADGGGHELSSLTASVAWLDAAYRSEEIR